MRRPPKRKDKLALLPAAGGSVRAPSAPDTPIKRLYEPAAADDGARLLVDRPWPRGLARARASLDTWREEAASSDDVRRCFGHQQSRWREFFKRYFADLDSNRQSYSPLRAQARSAGVTRLYARARLGAHQRPGAFALPAAEVRRTG